MEDLAPLTEYIEHLTQKQDSTHSFQEQEHLE